jgi:hypothetical protein
VNTVGQKANTATWLWNIPDGWSNDGQWLWNIPDGWSKDGQLVFYYKIEQLFGRVRRACKHTLFIQRQRKARDNIQLQHKYMNIHRKQQQNPPFCFHCSLMVLNVGNCEYLTVSGERTVNIVSSARLLWLYCNKYMFLPFSFLGDKMLKQLQYLFLARLKSDREPLITDWKKYND